MFPYDGKTGIINASTSSSKQTNGALRKQRITEKEGKKWERKRAKSQQFS